MFTETQLHSRHSRVFRDNGIVSAPVSIFPIQNKFQILEAQLMNNTYFIRAALSLSGPECWLSMMMISDLHIQYYFILRLSAGNFEEMSDQPSWYALFSFCYFLSYLLFTQFIRRLCHAYSSAFSFFSCSSC